MVMKVYKLECPICHSENVYIASADPESLYAWWSEYLDDLDEFLNIVGKTQVETLRIETKAE